VELAGTLAGQHGKMRATGGRGWLCRLSSRRRIHFFTNSAVMDFGRDGRLWECSLATELAWNWMADTVAHPDRTDLLKIAYRAVIFTRTPLAGGGAMLANIEGAVESIVLKNGGYLPTNAWNRGGNGLSPSCSRPRCGLRTGSPLAGQPNRVYFCPEERKSRPGAAKNRVGEGRNRFQEPIRQKGRKVRGHNI
jgi:hypothetical protein